MSDDQGPQRSGWRWSRAALVFGLAVSAWGCSLVRRSGSSYANQGPLPERVQLRQAKEHPSVSLVAREGDPRSAVALALTHDLGSAASVGLAAMVQLRLRQRGFDRTTVHAHNLGLEIQTAVDSEERSRAFVEACRDALATPVAPGDMALGEATQKLRSFAARPSLGPAEATLANCSGDLGNSAGIRVPDLASADGASILERWRIQAFSSRHAAFAGVGDRKTLEATAQAVANGAPWPSGDAPGDPWPESDFAGVDRGALDLRISVALRVESGIQALGAAQLLGDNQSALGARIAGLAPGWKLERVAGTVRPRGGCLRIDLAPATRQVAPSDQQVEGLIGIALEEATAALAVPSAPAFAVERGVLSPTDPREVAGAAAWQALSNQLQPHDTRKLVAYAAPADSPIDEARLKRAIKASPSEAPTPIEMKLRLEAGQSELWALLANPCGTGLEGVGSAGQTALLLRSIASGLPKESPIRLESWLTADGMGVLAHTPRTSPLETAEMQAERLGSALGRALVEPLEGWDFTEARRRLLSELGATPRPGYWTALNALAPDHPSWLEPRGTWTALLDASPTLLEAARRAFIDGPIRLAVLAGDRQQQGTVLAAALDRWLRPARRGPVHCAVPKPSSSRPGHFTVETDREEDANRAYLVTPLPSRKAGIEPEARWAALALNQPGGWLDQALHGVSASAHAVTLGGSREAALLIEIHATTDSLEGAVSQVRGLLERLSRGSPAKDFEPLRARAAEADLESSFDPRRRLVSLWRSEADPEVTATSFNQFLRRAFQPEALTWVTVVQRIE